MSISRAEIRKMAEEHIQRGDPSGWFEELYQGAHGDASSIPWADLEPNPNLISWAKCTGLTGQGRRALKIGCGLGDDAEELSRYGFDVMAFDVSPTAIEWCRRRFPDSPVNYVVADLFCPPSSWDRHFDFVLESYTIQSFLPELRPQAMEMVSRFLVPGGTLLVICRGRDREDNSEGVWPVPLDREELSHFRQFGLKEISFEDFLDSEVPPVRRFRSIYERPKTP